MRAISRTVGAVLCLIVAGALLPADVAALTFVIPQDGTYRIAVERDPEGIAAGYVNGDGIVDLVVANSSSDSVSVLHGKTSGGFMKAGKPYGAPNRPVAVALPDLNRDGRTDLVVLSLSDTVSVRLGKADGTFRAADTFGVGDKPVALLVTDLNGDGHPDIATANVKSSDVSLLYGKGTGGFDRMPRLSTGAAPIAIAAGDLDGDTRPDLVTTHLSGTVSVYLAGTSTFDHAADHDAGTALTSSVLADFDADTNLDVASTDADTGSVSVLFGDGTGSFSGAEPVVVGAGPRAIASGDMNTDGVPDVVTANETSGDVSIALSDRSRGFIDATGSPYPIGSELRGMVLSDFDANDVPDVAVTMRATDEVVVLLNDSRRDLVASPTSLHFGEQETGTESATSTVVLDATDGLAVTVSDVELAGAYPTDFVVTEDGCTGRTLGDGYERACEVVLRFVPREPGPRSARLEVASDAPSSPATVTLSGVGTLPVDTSAPETNIDEHPPALTNDASPTFAFTSDEPGSRFECRVDGEPFVACTSPHTVQTLLDGNHRFEVAASDQSGNQDPTPADFSFSLDTVRPVTEISGPSRSRDRRVRFSFTFSENASFVRCAIDGSAFGPCRTPYRTPKLKVGRHTLTVRATDDAGNEERPGRSKTFRVTKRR